MPKENNFLKRFILDPLNDTIFGWRQILQETGGLSSIDQLFTKKIEDPIIYNLFKKVYDLKIYNSNIIPKNESIILISNFQSTLDPMLITTIINHKTDRLPVHVIPSFLSNESLLMNFNRMNEAIIIRIDENDEDAFRLCEEKLNNGKIITFFPEGDINSGSGNLLPFKEELIHFILKSNVDIIPVAIYGMDQVYGKNMTSIKFEGNVRIKFGERIKIHDLLQQNDQQILNYKDIKSISRKLENIINRLWSELQSLGNKNNILTK